MSRAVAELLPFAKEMLVQERAVAQCRTKVDFLTW
ncbi:Uncharacterised protein [Halioglobus japonicus]|nr:Uncharacterised protein [Halioglobus japonicus]